MINISYHSCSQVVIEGPELNIIREHFSVKNEAAHFQRRMGRFVPSRTYVITNNGKVDVGLVFEIVNFCTDKKIQYTIEEKVISTLIPSLKKEKVNNYNLSLSFRDYQQEIINKCINTG